MFFCHVASLSRSSRMLAPGKLALVMAFALWIFASSCSLFDRKKDIYCQPDLVCNNAVAGEWTYLGLGGQHTRISHISVNPCNPSHILASGSTGLYQSRDCGRTWDRVWSRWVARIHFDMVNPRIIRAASDGMLESRDGGQTWTEMPYIIDGEAQTGVIGPMIFDPSNPSRAYASRGASGALFYISDDGGATWTTLPGLGPGETASDDRRRILGGTTDIVVNPANSQEIWVHTHWPLGYLRSLDRGQTWYIVEGPTFPQYTEYLHSFQWSLKFHPLTNEVYTGAILRVKNESGIWYSAESNVYISPAGQSNWRTVPIPFEPMHSIYDIVFTGNDKTPVFSISSGIYELVDGEWVDLNANMGMVLPRNMHLTQNGALYITTNNSFPLGLEGGIYVRRF